MFSRKALVAALVVLGLAVLVLEDTLVHSDDGCVVETHCNACLLRLATPGIVTAAFSLPRIAVATDRVPLVPTRAHESAAPRDVPSRGPPVA
jgi:hypothetical protein